MSLEIPIGLLLIFGGIPFLWTVGIGLGEYLKMKAMADTLRALDPKDVKLLLETFGKLK